MLFQRDLTICSLLNVAGYWIYGPLWGSFSCYTHKFSWTMLLAYLPLVSWHWTKDLGGTQGGWLIQQGTIPLLSGPRSLLWHFLLGFFCVVWLQEAGLRASLHASSDALSTGKAPRHLRARCQEQKVLRQENLKVAALKVALVRSHPTSLGHGIYDKGSCRDNEMRKPKICQWAIFHSWDLVIHLTLSRCDQHKEEL